MTQNDCYTNTIVQNLFLAWFVWVGLQGLTVAAVYKYQSLIVCELSIVLLVNPFPLFFSSLAGSSIAVSLLGVAYFAKIQHIAYFIVVQILSGIMQVWPMYNLYYIMAYGSTSYVGMALNKNGGHIKSAQMTSSNCLR